jgi:ferritin-like protein
MGFLFNLIGGLSVQSYLVIACLFGGFGAGFYLEHLRFSEYQIDVENAGKAQEAYNKSVEQQHAQITKGIQDEYDAKLSLVKQSYASGMHNSSGSSMSVIPNTTISVNDPTAVIVLAEQCSETTLQLVELQKWINEQAGIK